MENIVTRIIEIDQQASEKLAASEEEMREILADAKAKAARRREELESAAEKRIQEVTAFYQGELQLQSQSLRTAHAQAAASLDQTFAARQTEMENELFHAILGA